MSCLQCFTKQDVLDKHKKTCLANNNGTQKVTYEEGIIKCTNYQNQIPFPFKIYADIECFSKKIDIQKGKHTKLYHKHIPNSIAAKLVCIDDKYALPVKIFEGDNCINKCLKWVFDQHKKCNEIITKKFRKILKMTPEDEENYKNSNKCWKCTERIINKKDKVRDHCHITGKYRGTAHKECNSKIRIPRKLPVIFHNLQGYDGHIIFREIYNLKDTIDIYPIPKSTEKYMAFSINTNKSKNNYKNTDIAFLDSMQFVNASLGDLAKNLEDKDFKYLVSEFLNADIKDIRRKGAYPYEQVNSYEKFNNTELPPKKSFYSSLNDSKRGKGNGHISDEDYEYANYIWKKFRFKTFEEYHRHYLKTDVLILADIFENFINRCLNFYKLEPCNYYSLRGRAWDAMLKMTKIELEKISDDEIHQFIERAIRGGICIVVKRHSKANNKFFQTTILINQKSILKILI